MNLAVAQQMEQYFTVTNLIKDVYRAILKKCSREIEFNIAELINESLKSGHSSNIR
jgi:hypothetical protein